jgi:DNA-binding transcriptional LysR family regulator
MKELSAELTPSDMLVFASVAREGSFTKAGLRLGITKQSVSDRIAKLERALGTRLLERTTRSVRPTEVGVIYAQRCIAMASLIDEANQEVRTHQVEPTGQLRVSAPYLYGRRFLAPTVSEYLHRYPKAQVELVLSDRRSQLVEEGFDLAIRIGKLEDSSLAMRRLGDAYVYYVAHPRLGKMLRTNGRLKNFADMPTIGTRATEVWDIEGKKQPIRPRAQVNDLEMACELACLGHGVARVPSLVCRSHVIDGRLEILWRESAFRQPVFAVYPSAKYLTTKVRAFLAILSEHVEPMAEIAPALRHKAK